MKSRSLHVLHVCIEQRSIRCQVLAASLKLMILFVISLYFYINMLWSAFIKLLNLTPFALSLAIFLGGILFTLPQNALQLLYLYLTGENPCVGTICALLRSPRLESHGYNFFPLSPIFSPRIHYRCVELFPRSIRMNCADDVKYLAIKLKKKNREHTASIIKEAHRKQNENQMERRIANGA